MKVYIDPNDGPIDIAKNIVDSSEYMSYIYDENIINALSKDIFNLDKELLKYLKEKCTISIGVSDNLTVIIDFSDKYIDTNMSGKFIKMNIDNIIIPTMTSIDDYVIENLTRGGILSKDDEINKKNYLEILISIYNTK